MDPSLRELTGGPPPLIQHRLIGSGGLLLTPGDRLLMLDAHRIDPMTGWGPLSEMDAPSRVRRTADLGINPNLPVCPAGESPWRRLPVKVRHAAMRLAQSGDETFLQRLDGPGWTADLTAEADRTLRGGDPVDAFFPCETSRTDVPAPVTRVRIVGRTRASRGRPRRRPSRSASSGDDPGGGDSPGEHARSCADVLGGPGRARWGRDV